nr:YbfB/YjiJ family MFS transporter [Brucella sp. 6810]
MNTINAIGYIAGTMTVASITQRLGTARTYGLGAFLTVAAVLALGFTDSFITLSLLRLLSGVSGAFIFVAGGTMAANLAADHPEQRGVIVGLFYAGAGFGISFSGLIVPYWIEIFGITGWRTAWLLLGATGLVFAAAGYLAAAPSGFCSQTKSTNVRYRPLAHRWILAGYAAFGAGSIGYMTFIVAYLKASAQPSWHVSAFWVVIGLSAMAAPWLWSQLLMRSRQAHAFATLVDINALGAAIPLISMSFPAIMTSAVIFGAVFFAVVTATTNFVQHNVALASRASAIGTFTVLFGLGLLIERSITASRFASRSIIPNLFQTKRQRWQAEFLKMPVVRLRGCLNLFLKNIKLSVHICEIDFLLCSGSTHIAGDIEIEVVLLLNLIKAEHPRIAVLFLPVLVGIDDFVYVLGKERVLSLARLIMLCRVDEQNVVGPLAFLQH